MCYPFHKLYHEVIQLYYDCRVRGNVFKKSPLAAHRLAFVHGYDLASVYPAGEVVIDFASLAECVCEVRQRNFAQLRTFEHTHIVHLLCRFRPDTPKLLYRKI